MNSGMASVVDSGWNLGWILWWSLDGICDRFWMVSGVDSVWNSGWIMR